jgi:hypothetical protein
MIEYWMKILLITFVTLISLVSALIIFFNTIKQQRLLHETIIRSQNEKEIETYNRIAGEYLHQQVINGRILPHLIQLKELNRLIVNSKVSKNQDVLEKVQELINGLR